MSEPLDRLTTALAGRYAVERELGHGGMATVYLAHDVKHRRPVAIKVLKPEVAALLGSERFLREVEIAARLSHPHILPLFDSGEAGGFLYYVMPFVAGESLRHRLNRETQLPIPDALRIAREVADALSLAHTMGVIHRDIKPENILLHEGHAVVADFGIARALAAADAGRLTGTGFALGTPHYMSPEQALGESNVDARTDIYALACVLYEMLSGDPPFTGPTSEAITARKLLDPPPSVRQIREAVPPELDAVIRRGLARTPVDRFATMPEFTAALPDATGDLWKTPAPHQPIRRRPLVFRRPLLSAAMGAIALSMPVGWFSLPFLSPPRADTRQYVKSIAVLYFDDTSPRALDADFGKGLTEELMARLTTIRTLRVVPRIDVLRYRGSSASSGEIARALGVDAILEGTVRIVGPALRVSAQLIDAGRGVVTTSWSFDGDVQQILSVQDTITNRIVRALNLALSPGEQRRIRRHPSSDFQAYQLFLQGEAHLTRWTAPAVDSAIGLFRSATRLDSTFADAYAYVAFASLVQTYFGVSSDDRSLEAIRSDANRALALDRDNEMAIVSAAGYHLLRLRRERPGLLGSRDMIVNLKRLVARSPGSPLGELGLAHYYLWFKRDTVRGRAILQAALDQADATLQVEPGGQFNRGIAAEISGLLANVVYRSERDLDLAIALTQRSIGYVPIVRTYDQLVNFYALAKRHEEAGAARLQVLPHVTTPGDSGRQYASAGLQYYAASRIPEAVRNLAAAFPLLERATDDLGDYTLLYWVILSRRIGRHADAERALEARAAPESSRWVDLLIGFYAGRLSEDVLLRAATREWQKCEAYYYLGTRALEERRPADARRYFQQSEATGARAYTEWDLSHIELDWMGREASAVLPQSARRNS